MYKKKICLIEDYNHLKFMEELFKDFKEKYALDSFLDLSDEGVFKARLPGDYDIYWLHSSSTEFDAIRKIREEQPWSKIVLRTGTLEGNIVQKLKDEHKIDWMIAKDEGTNEQKVMNILQGLGIDLSKWGTKK